MSIPTINARQIEALLNGLVEPDAAAQRTRAAVAFERITNGDPDEREEGILTLLDLLDQFPAR